MPGLEAALEAAYQAGALAAFVGGAGPTLAALTTPEQSRAVQQALHSYAGEGQVLTLGVGSGYHWRPPKP